MKEIFWLSKLCRYAQHGSVVRWTQADRQTIGINTVAFIKKVKPITSTYCCSHLWIWNIPRQAVWIQVFHQWARISNCRRVTLIFYKREMEIFRMQLLCAKLYSERERKKIIHSNNASQSPIITYLYLVAFQTFPKCMLTWMHLRLSSIQHLRHRV